MDKPVIAAEAAPPKTPRTFAQFLESTPPDTAEEVLKLTYVDQYGSPHLSTPNLNLHCEACGGIRIFFCGLRPSIATGMQYETFTYKCRNCQTTTKTFSVVLQDGSTSKLVQKLGEHPSFGPPTPPRVIKLIGPDRELFLKGRRAELRGLGIGAFAYYRRVVEDHKSRIIEEIGKVAAKLGASKETMKLFAEAETENQFSAAIEKIKAAIPESLLISGHNPLTLLHSALSEGLHDHTDEECLELATSIRVVLTELADRISIALKDEAELKNAVSRLLNRK